MERIAEDFALIKNSNFVNSEGSQAKYHGSSDVKGIKAGDGRMYLMDLIRLSPRDANFPDQVSHETCVLRSELIGQFIHKKSLEDKNKTEGEARYTMAFDPSLLTGFESQNEDKEKSLGLLKEAAEFLKSQVLDQMVVQIGMNRPD
jgi:hypothetical protein